MQAPHPQPQGRRAGGPEVQLTAKPQVALRGQQCLQLQKVRLLLPEEDPDEGGGAGGRPGAGLQFPVNWIHRLLRSASGDLFPNSLLGRKGNYTGAPVYMAVVME